MADTLMYEKLIFENAEKGVQVNLTISEFNGVTYLSLRKYFLSFDEGYVPSKEGITMPFEMTTSFSLLAGLIDICSQAESDRAVADQIEKSRIDKAL